MKKTSVYVLAAILMMSGICFSAAENELKSAFVELSCNGHYDIYLNGKRVYRSVRPGKEGEIVRRFIPLKLLAEKNVLCCRLKNASRKRGEMLLLSYMVHLVYADGERKSFPCDAKGVRAYYTDGSLAPPKDEAENAWVAPAYAMKEIPGWKKPRLMKRLDEPGRFRVPFLAVTIDGKTLRSGDTYYFRQKL